MIPKYPFYFLRHGQTEHNAKAVLSGGNCDVPLNAHGVKQAQKIRPYIQDLPIQVIYHSPLMRAKQTMEIIASHLPHEKKEIDEMRECLPSVWLSMNRIYSQKGPISEATKHFFDQVTKGMHRILDGKAVPLIVAHGGVHFALCHLLAIKNHPKAIDNCTLVFFSPDEEGYWVAEKSHI